MTSIVKIKQYPGITIFNCISPGYYYTPSDTSNIASAFIQQTFDGVNYKEFEISEINANLVGFSSVIYANGYMYYIPKYNGTTASGLWARCPNLENFTNSNAYETFDMTTVNTAAKGFSGAVFDGRYIYFSPNINTPGISGLVARFDTQYNNGHGFGLNGAYSFFDLTTIDANAKGFSGVIYDGSRYVYFVPNNSGLTGLIVRYDTQASFTTSGSYAKFDATTVNSNCKGFSGAVYASINGNYIYFAPNLNGASGRILRYNTAQSFTSAGSYASFDAAAIDANLIGFTGVTSDGTYIYFASGNASGKILKYDPNGGGFTSSGSYAFFDATTVDAAANAFSGCLAANGKVYFIPGEPTSGLMIRYNGGDFTSSGSYSKFDLATIDTDATGFSGAAFDGRFVYISSYYNNTDYIGKLIMYDTTQTFTSITGSNNQVAPLFSFNNANYQDLHNWVLDDAITLTTVNYWINKYNFIQGCVGIGLAPSNNYTIYKLTVIESPSSSISYTRTQLNPSVVQI